MFVQMPLKIGLRDEACFETFVTEQEALAVALSTLQNSLSKDSGSAFFLYGAPGGGKTHLLQAACRFVTEKAETSVYLPLADESLPLIPDVLAGLEQMPLVCLDDIEQMIGDANWELALANLITRSSVQGHVVLLSGNAPMNDWNIVTQELVNALINVVPIEIQPLEDRSEVVIALQRHSAKMGFELPLEVGNFLIKNFSSDLQELLAVLKILEQATLVEKRRLTLPFVKQVLQQV